MEVDIRAFNCLSDGDSATRAPRFWCAGHLKKNWGASGHMGDSSAPYDGQLDGSHMQEVLLHLPL